MSSTTGVHALVRRTHEERVLSALRSHGALSRGELAKRVGLSRTTLSEITAQLLQRGAIIVADTDAATRAGSGRPAERLALDPESGQFLGVDFGHRRVHVAVADASVSAKLASDLPAAERPRLEYLAGASFDAYLHARKNRQDDFFIRPAGGADLCNINVPVRAVPAG